jgi:dolichyl-phosphate-mannose-protein mannosyltransferase
MNAFEPVFWTACVYMSISTVQQCSKQRWLLVGLVAGIGLLNKHSLAFFDRRALPCLIAARRRECTGV